MTMGIGGAVFAVFAVFASWIMRPSSVARVDDAHAPSTPYRAADTLALTTPTRPSLWLRARMWWARRWSWRVLAQPHGTAVQICCGFVDEMRDAFMISSLPAVLDTIARTPLGEPWLTPGGYLVPAHWVPIVSVQLRTIERAAQRREVQS